MADGWMDGWMDRTKNKNKGENILKKMCTTGVDEKRIKERGSGCC